MIAKECKEVIRLLSVKKFVEAGTDMGETVIEVSKWFSEFDTNFGKIKEFKKSWARCYNAWNEPIEYPVFSGATSTEFKVYSCDIDQYSYETAKDVFSSNPNIIISNLSSEAFIESLVADKKTFADGAPLFFLDTHWIKPWPLPRELRAICQLNKFIVVIDDFMVPGKSSLDSTHCEFGYTSNEGWILNWGAIKEYFSGKKVRVFYPNEPTRDKRGWVIIFCGFEDEKVSQLKEKYFFEVSSEDPMHSNKIKLPTRAYLDHILLVRLMVPMRILRPTIRFFHKLLWKLGA